MQSLPLHYPSFLCLGGAKSGVSEYKSRPATRRTSIAWQQRPQFATAHSQYAFSGVLPLNFMVTVHVTSVVKLFNTLAFINTSDSPLFKTLIDFILLDWNIQRAFLYCPFLPCLLADWYASMFSCLIFGNKAVLNFHPAVGGGTFSLERDVLNLYCLVICLTLLSNKLSRYEIGQWRQLPTTVYHSLVWRWSK